MTTRMTTTRVVGVVMIIEAANAGIGRLDYVVMRVERLGNKETGAQRDMGVDFT